MRCALGFFLLAFGLLAASPVVAAKDEVVFTKLPTADVTTMAVTEDGRFLVVAHESKDQVTVWSVLGLKRLHTLECPSPRHILSRGGRVFVASSKKGSISVFLPEKNWEMADSLDSGLAEVWYLSAPQGKHFSSHILASGMTADMLAKSRQSKLNLANMSVVDTVRDKHFLCGGVSSDAISFVDYEGTRIFRFDPDGLGQGMRIYCMFSFPEVVATGQPVAVKAGLHRMSERMGFPLLQQVSPGRMWFGGAIAWEARPSLRNEPHELVHPHLLPGLVIPDRKSHAVYVLQERTLQCLVQEAQDGNELKFREVATRPAVLLPGWTRLEQMDWSWQLKNKKVFYDPIAVTLSGQLTLFVLDRENTLAVAQTKPFDLPPAPRRESQPESDPTKDRIAVEPSTLGKMPEQIAVGNTLRVPFIPENKADSLEIMQAPEGATVEKLRVLIWKPTQAQLGPQTFKIKIKVQREVKVERFVVNVVASGLSTEPQDLAQLGAVEIYDGGKFIHDVFPTANGTAICVLRRSAGPFSAEPKVRSEIVFLDAKTFQPRRTTVMPQFFKVVRERPDYCVAAVERNDRLYLLDKRTLEVKKEIVLPGQFGGSLVLHPGRRVAYTKVYNDAGGKRAGGVMSGRLVQVDEISGTVVDVPRCFGGHLAVDPTGKYLFSSLHTTEHVSDLIDLRAGQIIAQYDTFHLLLQYDIRGRLPKYAASNFGPGTGNAHSNAHAVVSPNGKFVVYVSPGGLPTKSSVLPVFPVNDIQKEPGVLSMEGFQSTGLAFHPILDMAAVTDGKLFVLMDRATGKRLENRVKTDGGVPRDHVVRGLLFSPDGKYLLVRYHGPHLEAVKQPLSEKIYRFPLLFTQDERARIARGPQPPPLDPTLAAALASPEPLLGEKIPRESIGALLKRDRKESTPKQISREHSDGVVVVKSGRATASGFIVGKQGYILTCAHVLHPFRAPTVTYRPVAGGKPETVESAVVAFDDVRDLAVLKIVPNAALKEVPLAMDATVETGESVTVIGNPGVGETILANSLTTGVVSSADREIEKRHFLQTTAAVNPGNSGGPMFNSEGQVIGVVVAKANIEGTAFAVPLGEILAFFKENTAAAKK